MASVVELCDLVVVWSFNALFVVCIEFLQSWEVHYALVIGLERLISLKELLLRDPAHEVDELEEDKVHIGHVVANEELLVPEVGDEWLDFVEQCHRNSGPVACCVAWHCDGSLQVRNLSSYHLDLSGLSWSLA